MKAKRPKGGEMAEVNEFKRLFNQVHFQNEKHNTQIFAVTSASPGEGKSTVAAYLSSSSALYRSTKTLLVDCDLRRPTIHKLHELPRRPGLSDVLEGHRKFEKAVVHSRLDPLDILTAGTQIQSPADLFSSSDFVDILSYLRTQYKVIILDTPPLLPVSDTLLISNLVDGILMVVKAGKTPKKVAQRALSLLQENQSKVVGAVVNNLKNALPYYYDYSYYDYSYSAEDGA